MKFVLLPAVGAVLLLAACVKTETPWPEPSENYFTYQGQKVGTTACVYNVYPTDWDVLTTGQLNADDRAYHALGVGLKGTPAMTGTYRIAALSGDTLLPGTASISVRDQGDTGSLYHSVDQAATVVVSVDASSGRVTLDAPDFWVRNRHAPYDSFRCAIVKLRSKQ